MITSYFLKIRMLLIEMEEKRNHLVPILHDFLQVIACTEFELSLLYSDIYKIIDVSFVNSIQSYKILIFATPNKKT
jgi:hypothetical protein